MKKLLTAAVLAIAPLALVPFAATAQNAQPTEFAKQFATFSASMTPCGLAYDEDMYIEWMLTNGADDRTSAEENTRLMNEESARIAGLSSEERAKHCADIAEKARSANFLK